jgi:RecB family endonuclease NucS
MRQLGRYLDLLNHDPLLAPVHGSFALRETKARGEGLAEAQGIRCVVLDNDVLRGIDNADDRLF